MEIKNKRESKETQNRDDWAASFCCDCDEMRVQGRRMQRWERRCGLFRLSSGSQWNCGLPNVQDTSWLAALQFMKHHYDVTVRNTV